MGVKLINKNKFPKTIFDKSDKVFVIYIFLFGRKNDNFFI